MPQLWCRLPLRDSQVGLLLVIFACGLLVQPAVADQYQFVTLFNLSKSVYAGAAGELVSVGQSAAGVVETFSSPTVPIGQPEDPGSRSDHHLAEWCNFALAGREFVYRPGRQWTPQIIAVFAVEDANLTFSVEGALIAAAEVPSGTVEHVVGDFTSKDVDVISTGDVVLAGASGGTSYVPVPPVAETIFGQCSTTCRTQALGGDPGIVLTRSCTDGTVEQVAPGGASETTYYLGRTCRWDAPSGHKISGRVHGDGGGNEGTVFLAPEHFQRVTPVPASMSIMLLVSDTPATCTHGGANFTLTGANGVYHARLTDVVAGTVFECDAPVMAVGDADCPDSFDRSCTSKEMNIIAAPVDSPSSTSTSSPLTISTTTNTTTSLTATATETTSSTNTRTSTNTSTGTTSVTTVSLTSTATTSATTASLTSTNTTTVTTASLTSTNTTSATTISTTVTISSLTSTNTTSATTISTTVTTASLTSTNTTSATTVSLTSTSTATATTITSTATTQAGATATQTATATATTSTATTATISTTSVTHTTATTPTATVTTATTTATTTSATTTSATSVTRTSVTTPTITATSATVTATTTSATTPTATATSVTGTSTTTYTELTLTATTTSAALAATATVTTLTVTTTTTTTLAVATVLVRQVELLEVSLFSAILDSNTTTSVERVDNFTLVVTKLDASVIAAAGGNLTVVAAGIEAAATVSSSLLTTLDAEDSGVVLVLTSFDPSTAATMSTDGGSETQPSAQVRAAVNLNLYALHGDTVGNRLKVANLKDPVRVVMPVNYSADLQCVFWDEANSRWATDGVVLISSADDHVVCESTHLTLFAAIARGFINTFLCSQASLLKADALRELTESDWYRTLGAQALASLVAAFLLLLAVAAYLDWSRWRQGRCSDEHFLIPVDVRQARSNFCLLPEGAAAAGSCLCLSACPAFCSWCRTSGALRDALDDVISNWASHFSEIRDFLEGFVEGLDLSDLTAAGCCRAGAKAPVMLIQRVMSSTLSVSARRQAAVAVGISRDSSCFLIQDEDIADVMVDHQSHQAQHAHQAKQTQVAHHTLPGPFISEGSNISATTRRREEAWAQLHSKVEAKMDAYMEASARWSSVPSSVWRLFLEQNPFSASLVQCAFTSSKLRVLLLMVDITGALMLSTVFFTATGTPGKRNRSVDCSLQDPWEKLGRVLAIGTVSLFAAGIPSMVLGSLCTRGIKKFAYEGCPEWKRQLQVWRIQDRAIWVLGLLYVGWCVFFMSLFLANVAQKDQGSWLLSGIISVVEDTIIIPLAVALTLPLLCTLCLSFMSSHDRVKKEDLISERNVEVKRQSNLTLPVEKI